jgi:hypothetical protein
VEIGDRHRFTGNTIGSFVGLVRSEFSSAASRVQGPITKTGNGHVRRLLVEAAWHHHARYVVGKTMREDPGADAIAAMSADMITPRAPAREEDPGLHAGADLLIRGRQTWIGTAPS